MVRWFGGRGEVECYGTVWMNKNNVIAAGSDTNKGNVVVSAGVSLLINVCYCC